MQFKGTQAITASTQYSCSNAVGAELITTNELPNQSNDHLQVGNSHVTTKEGFSDVGREKNLTLE